MKEKKIKGNDERKDERKKQKEDPEHGEVIETKAQ